MTEGRESLFTGDHVWIGILDPAPDYPPQPLRIERVFAGEEQAKEWWLEGPPPRMNGPRRRIEKHEVVR